MSRRTRGFTILEVAAALTVVAVLAAIAVPLYLSAVEPARVATMKSDLRNLAVGQEAHFGDQRRYAADAASMGGRLQTSKNVTVFVDSGTVTGWGATATHSGTLTSCRIAYGHTGFQAPTCSRDPLVRIVMPGAGAAVASEAVRFVLSTGGVRMTAGAKETAHHHLFIDREVTPFGDPVPHDDVDIIHLQEGESELWLPGLATGPHEVIAVLTDGAHVPLVPLATDTVRFSVSRR
ncbi:MAG: DUF4399 domain-containing protein [Gemmatimonadota bacterium]|nr:DUF4399 domain-containing protein [Gemmatimonadota bacterium]